MHSPAYFVPRGGHPPQTDLLSGRAVFTEAYAVIPGSVMRDIVASALPFWNETRAWILARPLSGFAETFSQYIMEVGPGGGSEQPEPDPNAEAVLFVVSGDLVLTLSGSEHRMKVGGYAYIRRPLPGRYAMRARSPSPSIGFANPMRRSVECSHPMLS